MTAKKTTKLFDEVITMKARARHERGPWRIDASGKTVKCQIGRPKIREGLPVHGEDDELALVWESFPFERAQEEWSREGWLIE